MTQEHIVRLIVVGVVYLILIGLLFTFGTIAFCISKKKYKDAFRILRHAYPILGSGSSFQLNRIDVISVAILCHEYEYANEILDRHIKRFGDQGLPTALQIILFAHQGRWDEFDASIVKFATLLESPDIAKYATNDEKETLRKLQEVQSHRSVQEVDTVMSVIVYDDLHYRADRMWRGTLAVVAFLIVIAWSYFL